MASLLLRPLGVVSPLRLDVGWGGRVLVADAPLRTLGCLGRRVVLDSRAPVGTRQRLVGLRARLRELVSAGLQQLAGYLGQHLQRRAALLLVGLRVDRGAVRAVRAQLLRAPA